MKISPALFFIVIAAVICFIPGCFSSQQNARKNVHTRPTIDKELFNPSAGVSITYPVLKDLEDTTVQAAVNRRLYEIFIGDPNSFNDFHEGQNEECPSTYECDFTSEQHNYILAITEKGCIYEGGAHGMPFHEMYYIDIRDGRFYHLGDLLKETSDLQKLTNLVQCLYQEKKEELGGFDDVIDCLPEDQSFTIRDEGLEIYFRPYEIACYAAGFPSFTLSWEEVDDLIDSNGDFYKAYFA